MSLIAAVLGRLLIALLFFGSGVQKLLDPAPAARMIESIGFPGSLALPVGIFEIAAAVLLAIGLMTRLVSILLAAYVVLTILFFHHELTDPVGLTETLMHFALLGGLLMVFAYGQMRGSYDYMRARGKTYDAEVRAARAEGRAEGVASAPHTTRVVTDVDGDGVPEVRPKRRWF